MANGQDNVQINIKAIVQGLESVRLLVREIEKLPGAGDGISKLSKEFASVQKELQAAGNELRAVGADAQRVINQTTATTSRLPNELNKVTRQAGGTKTAFQSVATSATAMGRALEQALRGDVLGAIQSVGVALNSSLNFAPLAATATKEVANVAKATGDTEKLLTKFSGVLGSAAKDAESQLSGALVRDFGIKAEQALLNPEIALQKFVSNLAQIPDAAERAIATSNIFGASTAALLPTIEGLVATEQAAAAAADNFAAAQTALTTAQAAVATTSATEAAALESVVVAETSGIDTAADIALAKQAAAVASVEATAAREAEVVATEALAMAEQELAAVTAEVVVAEEAATVASAGFMASIAPVAIALGAILAVAGGVILIGAGIAKSFADAGVKMQDLSEKSGATVETLSALKLAAGETRTEFSKVETALPRFAKNLNEAAGGNKQLANTFKQLGVDVKAGVGNTDAALAQFLKKFQTIPPGAQQADAAFKAFGRSGTDLIPIFNRVGGDLAKFREETAKLGGMTSEQAAAAAKFQDAYEELGFALTNVKNSIGAELLPTLTDLAGTVTSFIKDNKEGFADLASVISVAFKVAIGVFLALGGTIAFLTNLVYGITTAIFGLLTAAYDLAAGVIQAGKALYQYLTGDVAGAVKTIEGAVADAKFAIADLNQTLQNSANIIATPTFTSLFKLFNGGDGSTPNTFKKPPAPTGSFKGGGAPKKAKVDPEIKAYQDAILAYKKASIQAELDLTQDGLKHEKEILDANFSQNLDSYEKYYKDLAGIQNRDVAAQIAAQEKLLALEQEQLGKAKKGSERVKAETEILKINEKLVELRHQQSLIEPLISVEVAKQARAYNDMITDIQNQLLDFEQRTSESANNRIEKDLREATEKAQAKIDSGDNTGKDDLDRINRLKDLLKAQAKFNELQQQVTVIENARGILEDELNTKVAQGILTRTQANQQLAQFEQDESNRIQDIVAGMEKYANKVGDPALIQAVSKIKNELQGWKVDDTTRQTDELKHQLDQLTTQFEIDQQRRDTAVVNGSKTEAQAYDERQAAIGTYSAATDKLLAQLEAIAVATHNADLQAYIDKARAGLSDLSADGDSLGQNLNQNFLGAFTDLFSALSDGTKSAGQAFADFGRQVLKILTDVAIQILVTKLALAAFGGAGGGQGGFGGFLSGLFGGDKAVGGHAQGGLINGVGTGTSDSNLRRLSNGEYVVNADATSKNLAALQAINSGLNPQRNLSAGANVSPAATMQGAMSGANLKVVNVLPNDLLANYVTGGDGRTALLNFIEDNAGGINTRLNKG